MKWQELINNTRLGCENTNTDINRNSYYRDFDRIIFSKEFRMLQTKTQVVPFPETDATHTRLTHSLETASVGRSLGINVGNLLELSKEGISSDDIGAIVSAACLCHDIGNPPLGHSGEKAIAQYFKDEKGSKILDKYVTQNQRFDFENFEGNAIGFNLLTNSNPFKTDVTGGFGLTYSTLGAFVKYPNRKATYDKSKSPKHLKKSGLLKNDVKTYKRIAEKLKIKEFSDDSWARHPLAYLTEASDDICYAIIDLEDGYRNGLIAFDEAEALLSNIIKQDDSTNCDYSKIKDKSEIMGYLRAKAVNALINMCVESFINNEKSILDGTFKDTLIDVIPTEATNAYKNLVETEQKKIYKHKNILLTEAAGFVVLPELLDIFISAAFSDNDRSAKIRDCILKELIVKDTNLEYEENNYQTILNIVKYVALMTDNYAVKLYRELKGIQLPNY